MKAVSQTYKDNIKQLGKEIDSYITYTLNNTNYDIGGDQIYRANLHYEGDILKSVMKQLDLEVINEIPIGTEITFRFGLKVSDNAYDEDDPIAYRTNYEYINYGTFIVYSSEKQEDSGTYKLVCYDKMLNAMKDYEAIAGITYPITIRNYINAVATHLGLTFENASDTFVNYDKEIPNELYIDNEGNNIGYTFRDVLNELAEVTASTICINDNGNLEIRYITNTNTNIDEESLKDINVNFGEMVGPINTITFKRSAGSDAISLSNPVDLSDDLKNEIVISDNQILNGDDRDDYISEILNKLYGLTYAINDFNSTGITYYDLCDKYNVVITKTDDDGNTIDNNTYNCIMFNDEINITQGLEEMVHTKIPEGNTTDYNTTTRTDRLKTRTDLIVDKQNGEILAVTGVLDIQEDGTSKVIDGIRTTQTQDRLKIEAIVTKEGEGENEVYTGVRTGDESKTFTFDTNGLTIESLNNAYKNIQDETGNYYYDNNTMIGKYTKDGSVQKNMALFGKYYYGVDENVNVETFNKDDAMFVSQLYEDGDGETGFGHFYNGD